FLNNAAGIYQNNNNTKLPLIFKKGTSILLDSQYFTPTIYYTPNNPTIYYGLANVNAIPSLIYIDGQPIQYSIKNTIEGITFNNQLGILSISRRTLPGNYTFNIMFNNNIDSVPILYNLTIRTSNDSARTFTNAALTTNTDTANSIHGDYINLPSTLDTSFQRDFTIETWFKVADSNRNQVIMEAISNNQYINDGSYETKIRKYPMIKLGINSNGNVYAYYPQAIGRLTLWGHGFYYYASGDSVQTAKPINNNRWYHLALVKQNNVVSLYLNGTLNSTKYDANTIYSYNTLGFYLNNIPISLAGANDFRFSEAYIGRVWEGDAVSKSFVGSIQEFKIWNQAITDINSLKMGTAYTFDNLVYYLPLNTAVIPTLNPIIPKNTVFKNQSNAFVSLQDSSVLLSKVNNRVYYSFDSNLQILKGTYSNFIDTGEQIQANTDAVSWQNIITNRNRWTYFLPSSFKFGKISFQSVINGNKNNNRNIADYYFVDNPANPQKLTFINANQRTGLYFLPPNYSGDYVAPNYVVTNNTTGATVTSTASPLILNNLNNNTTYNFTVQSVNRIKKSSGLNLTNTLLFGTLYNIYTNINNPAAGRIMIDSTVPANSAIRVTYTTNPGFLIDSILV
ncbi:MAG: LamG domain-containing protein, partial [Sediminibacterium sp.]|nr:LamG domain-containing protein [Sediminibacterium sp.]